MQLLKLVLASAENAGYALLWQPALVGLKAQLAVQGCMHLWAEVLPIRGSSAVELCEICNNGTPFLADDDVRSKLHVAQPCIAVPLAAAMLVPQVL